MRQLLLFFSLLLSTYSYAQTIDRQWNRTLEAAINQFKQCEDTVDKNTVACHAFVGRTLKVLYQIDDFYSSQLGRYMHVDEIYDYLQNNPRWTLLGKGYEPKALAKAQSLANQKKAVVAVYLNEESLGHLAYILPGELRPSGTWRVPVPNSAAYFTGEPQKSYVNESLSYSFPYRITPRVYLYARAY